MEIIVSTKSALAAIPSDARKNVAAAIPSELRKHVAAIHTSGQLSFLERKMFNVLLANAFDTLLSKRRHGIPVSILSEMIGFNSKNVGDLKEALTDRKSVV